MYPELIVLLVVVLLFELKTAPNSGKVKALREDCQKINQSRKV